MRALHLTAQLRVPGRVGSTGSFSRASRLLAGESRRPLSPSFPSFFDFPSVSLFPLFPPPPSPVLSSLEKLTTGTSRTSYAHEPVHVRLVFGCHDSSWCRGPSRETLLVRQPVFPQEVDGVHTDIVHTYRGSPTSPGDSCTSSARMDIFEIGQKKA